MRGTRPFRRSVVSAGTHGLFPVRHHAPDDYRSDPMNRKRTIGPHAANGRVEPKAHDAAVAINGCFYVC